MTHIVGKLDSVLQKVADHRQEVMTSIIAVSPTDGHEQTDSSQTVVLRKRSSVDVSGETVVMAPPTPLRERIQNMRLSVTSATEQDHFNSLNHERRHKLSPASSIVECSGEQQASPSKVEEDIKTSV